MNRAREISLMLRDFREWNLRMPLVVLAENVGTNYKTLYAFETGTSNELKHLFSYLKVCTPKQKNELISKLSTILQEV